MKLIKDLTVNVVIGVLLYNERLVEVFIGKIKELIIKLNKDLIGQKKQKIKIELKDSFIRQIDKTSELEESDIKIEKLVGKFINKIHVTKFKEKSIDESSNLDNLKTLMKNIFKLNDILESKRNFIKSIIKLDFNEWKTEIKEKVLLKR